MDEPVHNVAAATLREGLAQVEAHLLHLEPLADTLQVSGEILAALTHVRKAQAGTEAEGNLA